ncbi:MAG: hypothetical protein QGG40_07835, partial [Myxococcota bacterium]|nr:hypothetical protein [Myxococcota bacterium]
MSTLAAPALRPGFELPINLGLNDGTHCPEACLAVMHAFANRTGLRNYSHKANGPLLSVIAENDGVKPENILLHNGSGPILKLAVPHLIRRSIKSSAVRIVRHLTTRNGFPIITPSFTYSKVPGKAAGLGLKVAFVPISPETDWRLDTDALRRELRRQDGLVYIV